MSVPVVAPAGALEKAFASLKEAGIMALPQLSCCPACCELQVKWCCTPFLGLPKPSSLLEPPTRA
eukprot:362930-Chlamydomonas_euryale.AAC.2